MKLSQDSINYIVNSLGNSILNEQNKEIKDKLYNALREFLANVKVK